MELKDIIAMQSDLLMTRNRKKSSNYAWNDCPPELLLMILDHYDARTNVQTLLNCLAVNRRWWNVVSSLVENRIGHEEFLTLALSDGGASFRKRAKLPSISDLLLNLCLWKDIHFTQITGNHIYDLTEVLNVNVYKDKIIVVTNRDVKYYNLNSHKLIKTLPIRCSNFDENEFMYLKVEDTRFDMDHIILEEMILYGKLTDRSELDDRFKFTSKIKFFRIYDNCCYYTTWAFTIFVAKWANNGWTSQLVGRYFGYGVITDVIVHNEDIVALLNWGGMLVADVGNSKLKLISRKKTSVIFELPAYASKSILYERYGAVATVPSTYPLHLSYNGVYWILECPDLMCSLKHGNMLILGYKNGKVEIYNPDTFSNKIRRLKPEVTITVQSLAPFDYELFDTSVRHLEVAEVKGGHVLIIVTSIYVHQVTLDHRL
ncbi:hypothetical protein ABMA27_015516 [Loxostege sticticalis]|uniref:F-box domain-containing protein n=1 Tax=Loxostege sticticalis TaxID=481309 RepID=A0ABR3I838_LOXSC